jgi:hypothetical protein
MEVLLIPHAAQATKSAWQVSFSQMFCRDVRDDLALAYLKNPQAYAEIRWLREQASPQREKDQRGPVPSGAK